MKWILLGSLLFNAVLIYYYIANIPPVEVVRHAFGGCNSHLETKCLCGTTIGINDGACPRCLADMDEVGDILDNLRGSFDDR